MEKSTLPDPIFELAEKFFSVAAILSKDQIRYLARSRELLESLLNIKDISLVSDEIGYIKINSQPEVSINKVICHPELVGDSPDGNADLNNICSATEEGKCYKYRLECDLLPDELLEYIGGKQTLKFNVFGLQQIRALAIKQTMKKKEGILDLNCYNYFPVINKRGNICFARIHWARYRSHTKLKGAHSWDFGIAYKDKYLHKGANLFIFKNTTTL